MTSIETEDEWNSLTSYLASKSRSNDFWIGANDIDELFKFIWISSGQQMNLTKFGRGEPNNLNGREFCIHLWQPNEKVEMFDWICNKKLPFICKADISNVESTPSELPPCSESLFPGFVVQNIIGKSIRLENPIEY